MFQRTKNNSADTLFSFIKYAHCQKKQYCHVQLWNALFECLISLKKTQRYIQLSMLFRKGCYISDHCLIVDRPEEKSQDLKYAHVL